MTSNPAESGEAMARAALVVSGLALLGTRLPLLAGSASCLDGDEALMALTARHVMDGAPIPVFPWGAGFGVSWLETATTATVGRVLGLTDTTVRLAMLLLWTAGAGCLVVASRRWAGPIAAGVAAVAIVTMPAWIRPSLAAWAYYQTGFLACAAALLLASTLDAPASWRRDAPRLVGLSFACSLAYFSQPIFAVAVLPFLGLLAWTRRRIADALVLAAGFVACLGAYWACRGAESAFWAPSILGDPDPLLSLARMPDRVFTSATGVFFLGESLPAGPVTRVAACLWLAACGAAGAAAIGDAVSRRRPTLGLACVLSIAGVLAFTLLVTPGHFGLRYLLPAAEISALLVATQVARIVARSPALRLVPVGGVVLAVASIGAVTAEIRHQSFSGSVRIESMPERQALEALVGHLRQRGIEHVYCTGAMLQWKLMFYGGGRITARWFTRTDRHPEFPRAVEAARRAGRPVAMVGEAVDLAALHAQLGPAAERVGDRYFVLVDPPQAVLGRWFRLEE